MEIKKAKITDKLYISLESSQNIKKADYLKVQDNYFFEVVAIKTKGNALLKVTAKLIGHTPPKDLRTLVGSKATLANSDEKYKIYKSHGNL